MTKVKICGIRTPEDVAIINEFKPDFIGYIFAPTWREISLETALKLIKQVDSSIQRVGVFVNRDIDFVAETLLSGAVDLLQLHGQEDREYEEKLFNLLIKNGVSDPQNKCIKAYRVRSADDILATDKTMCSRLLLDAYSEKDIGGTGESFDWTLIKNIKKPFFLAGGINADNVENAVKQVRPYAVDASSSLETDRKKDREKIKKFITNFRSIN